MKRVIQLMIRAATILTLTPVLIFGQGGTQPALPPDIQVALTDWRQDYGNQWDLVFNR